MDIASEKPFFLPITSLQARIDIVFSQNEKDLIFAPCAPPDPKTNIIRPLGRLSACRETMMENLETIISDLSRTSKGYFLLQIVNKVGSSIRETRLENAIRAVRLYESAFHFQPTQVHPVIRRYVDIRPPENWLLNRIANYCIICGKEWISAPYMLSLYFLMLKSFFRSALCNQHLASLESLEIFIRDRMQTRPYVAQTFPYWKLILQNRNYLFGKNAICRNWNPRLNGCNLWTMSREGIASLCALKTNAKKVNQRFKALLHSYNARRKD